MVDHHPVSIPVDSISLEGDLAVPRGAEAIVIFAHGSGSSRHSQRNNFVAEVLRGAGMGTLLFDLLTVEEDTVYENRFDIPLLTERLKAATRWIKERPDTANLSIGYYGASTGAAAALGAAADFGPSIRAIVSRGGRPDLAEQALLLVKAPTLLIVGGLDNVVIGLNQDAYNKLKAEKELRIVPDATHLFEEPGKLDEIARLAAEWFREHLFSEQ